MRAAERLASVGLAARRRGDVVTIPEHQDDDGTGEQASAGDTRNALVAEVVAGLVVQAGEITGGIHQHHPMPRKVVTPRQLPPAPAGFVGRVDELTALTEAFEQATSTGHTVLISALAGTGGIGKTWLALHWGHQHQDQFQDGQLFVDLRGFSPAGEPMPVADAVRGFLVALGIDPAHIPANLDDQIKLYRSLVADKQMLIVLDNAAHTDQVTPLLPGGSTCTVLVTSRRTLTSLISRHGAHHLRLDTFTTHDARELLTARLGCHRVSAEPDAVAELVDFCRGFALALGLIAGYAHTQPDIPLADLATDLRNLGLRALNDDDPAASVYTVLSWSQCALTAQQRKVFGLLGMSPGADIGLPAAARLFGLPEGQAHAVLVALVETSLLERKPGSRYVMHDLIRAYAATTAEQELPAELTTVALRRLLDFYAHTAYDAARVVNPFRESVPLGQPSPGASPLKVPNIQVAMGWFDAEYPMLLAAQRGAAIRGWHDIVWQLAWALSVFQRSRRLYSDSLYVWLAALDAATQLSNSNMLVIAHRDLGTAYSDRENCEARRHLQQALALAREHGDLHQQAQVHLSIACAYDIWNDYRRALEYAVEAHALYEGLDLPVWEANALNHVGRILCRLGDFDTARARCEAALAQLQCHGDMYGVADTLENLGEIAQRTNHHRKAIGYYQRAAELFRPSGDTTACARVLDDLGDSHAALGEHEQARTAWQEAEDLYTQQGYEAHAARVRQQLNALPQ